MPMSMSEAASLVVTIVVGFFAVVAATVYVQMPDAPLDFWLKLLLPWWLW